MSFDLAKFEQSQFKSRTNSIPVPALSSFYEEGQEPVWTVRGLSASELATANEAKQKNTNVSVVLEAISGLNKKEKVDEIRQALGIEVDVPGEIAKRLEMLVMGSTNPVIPLPLAVKLAKNFAIEFFLLTNEITKLTGAGSEIEGK